MIDHDSGRVRRFLMDFFSDEELNNLCFDYFPPVYNQLADGMLKGQKARLLVETCQRNGRMPDLLAALERERPDLYRDHFPTAPSAPTPTFQPIERNPRQVFISHARQDADIARRLAQDLSDHGWQIWIAPDSIHPGEKWVEAINRGLAESGVFVLVLTEAAVNSRWVQSETNAAINMEHRGELNFLPLEAEPVAAPPLWQSYQWISFRDDYQNGLENFLRALQPDVMAQLSQLYRQLQEAVNRQDWDKAQVLGEKILDQYPDYRDVADLVTMVKQKQREQRWRAWIQHLVYLLRRYAWIGALLLVSLASLSLLLWAVGEDGGSGEERLALTATARSIGQLQEATGTITPQPIGTAIATPMLDPNDPPLDAEAGDTWTRPLDSMVMVYVPPPDAPFVLGSGVDAPQEGYWIDKYEVSNAQYLLCMDAGECAISSYAGDERFNKADYPVVGVSWFDAATYSAWAGGELPTEGEWEYATVGDSRMDYPWGNEASCELANYLGCVNGTTAVDSYPEGASWVGVLNMVGNVWEWTASWYDDDEDRRVVRGGSWSNLQRDTRAAFRYRFLPSFHSGYVGFRVMRRPPSP